MKKFLIVLLTFLVGIWSYSQVGIGTTNPEASLHLIESKAYTNTTDAFSISFPNYVPGGAITVDPKLFKIRSNGSIRLTDWYDTNNSAGLHINYRQKEPSVYIGNDYNIHSRANLMLGVTTNTFGITDFSHLPAYSNTGIAVVSQTGNNQGGAGLFSVHEQVTGSVSGFKVYGGRFLCRTSSGTDMLAASTSSKSFRGVHGEVDISMASTNLSTVGYGVYAKSAGAATNYAIYADDGINYFKEDLGIGVLIPTEKLDVLGNIKASGALISGTTTYPDYVFEAYETGASNINKTYTFKTLEEVKTFIKVNNHLPGVTAIDNLQKTENGYKVNVSELSIQTLEKVEELYLHTIEQQETISALKSENKILKERLKKIESFLGLNDK